MRSQTKNRAELVARAYVDGRLDGFAWPPRLTDANQVRRTHERHQPVGSGASIGDGSGNVPAPR